MSRRSSTICTSSLSNVQPRATNPNWDQIIPGVSPNVRMHAFDRHYARALVAVSLALALAAAPVRKPSRAPHNTPAAQAPKAVGAAGLIAVAQHQLDLGNFLQAADYATSAAGKAPILDDYAHYIRAQAEYQLRNYDEVAKSVTHVFNQAPGSPFVGAAAALAVRAELDNNKPKDALDIVKKYYDRIPQPQADLLLARCFEAAGDLAQAAEYFQRVYYGYPSAPEATDAANALVDVKQRLGDAYPPPMPPAMIARAQKLFDAKNPAAAKIELIAAIPQMAGAARDLARVRLGVADYLANNTRDALAYLSTLKVDDPEADAERLNYLIHCTRKLDRHADVKSYLDQLEQQHPNSLWRLDALILVADQARVDNDAPTYLPLYRACAVTFPKDPRSAWCHWQISLDSYRHDSPDAYDLLRAHVQQYPDSTDANNALYFLGRLFERKNDFTSARACYDELTVRFPNTYYAIVARERLKDPRLHAAVPNPATVEFLHAIPWPPHPQFPSFTPGKLAQARIARAQLLQLTGLEDWAEDELKFGARTDGEQENVYAFELAKMAAARNAPDQAMRFIKVYAPNYLYMPLDEAPVQFWKLAFPIPYRALIEQRSRTQNLDPFLVAALIRQESEFNVSVKSPANAYGLMQLLPTTGRQLARNLGIRRFSSAQLLTADRNVQLGTYFFRNLLSTYSGQAELALASYNAGPGR
ncbi:MAG: transglycosylase SLT domain-containing protein, partial [Acidobacteriaceae bacterium]|nr:transglycosylase SLT domain-containing protein [Acidobacteriaceae bacterium]